MKYIWIVMPVILFLSSCRINNREVKKQPVYRDTPYLQDYAVKYLNTADITPVKALSDRNENIKILVANKKLYIPANGHFQYPGKIVPDVSYTPMKDRKISDMITYKEQFVYLDNKAVFSNARAGRLYLKHSLPEATMLCGGNDLSFLISDGKQLEYLNKSSHKKIKMGYLIFSR